MTTRDNVCVAKSMHVCAKDILEEAKQAVWDEKRNQKGCCWKWLLLQRNNNKSHTDDTQVSLRTTLLLLCLGVLSEWQVEHFFCGIYFGITTALRTLLALTFLQRDTPQWTGSNHWSTNNSHWPQLWNNLQLPLTPSQRGWVDDKRRTFWQVLRHNQRDGIFLPTTRQESEEEKKKTVQWLL